jgi:hypothetical protein
VDGVLRFGGRRCGGVLVDGGEGPLVDGAILPSIRSGREGRGGSRKTASVGRWRRRAAAPGDGDDGCG